jgi:hypothetical protein
VIPAGCQLTQQAQCKSGLQAATPAHLWSECTSGLLPMYRAPISCSTVGRHTAHRG